MSGDIGNKCGIQALFIYTDLIEVGEGDEFKKFLYYYPDSADVNIQLRNLSLTDALVKFTTSFKPDYKYEVLLTKRTRQIFYEPEKSFWITLIVELNEDPAVGGESTNEQILFAFLDHKYKLFKFFHGKLSDSFESLPIEQFRLTLADFFNQEIVIDDFAELNLSYVFNGVYYPTLDNLSFMQVNCFSNMLQLEYQAIRYVSIFFKDQVVLNGVTNDTIQILYRFLMRSILSSAEHTKAADTSSGLLTEKTINKNRVPGKFLTLNENDFATRYFRRVYIFGGDDDDSAAAVATVCNLFIFKKHDLTVCLFVKNEVKLQDDQLYNLEEYLEMKTVPLLNSLQTHSNKLATKASNRVSLMLARDLQKTNLQSIGTAATTATTASSTAPAPATTTTTPTTTIDTDSSYYFYYNHVNLAINTTLFTTRCLTATGAKVPKEVLEQMLALHSKYYLTKSAADDNYVVNVTVHIANSDFWIVYKVSCFREIFVVLKHKEASVCEIIEESKKVFQTQIKDIFYHE